MMMTPWMGQQDYPQYLLVVKHNFYKIQNMQQSITMAARLPDFYLFFDKRSANLTAIG